MLPSSQWAPLGFGVMVKGILTEHMVSFTNHSCVFFCQGFSYLLSRVYSDIIFDKPDGNVYENVH